MLYEHWDGVCSIPLSKIKSDEKHSNVVIFCHTKRLAGKAIMLRCFALQLFVCYFLTVLLSYVRRHLLKIKPVFSYTACLLFRMPILCIFCYHFCGSLLWSVWTCWLFDDKQSYHSLPSDPFCPSVAWLFPADPVVPPAATTKVACEQKKPFVIITVITL